MNIERLSTRQGDVVRRRLALMAGEIVDLQFEANPGLAQRYGPAGREKCLQDAAYHLTYLADAMDAADPVLFTTYIAWVKVMLGKRNVPVDDLVRHLELTRTVVGSQLEGDERSAAVELLSVSLAQLPVLPSELPSCLTEQSPYSDLAREYLSALLHGDRQQASQKVLSAVAAGAAVKDIYLHVFQPVLYEIGRLWQVNEISVAQEHYSTAATQLIMSQLYPHIFASLKSGRTLVATCVAGDLHEIGVRMVADFFEMDGWNTFYLGANMPHGAVIDTILQRKAHVLAISATIPFHLRAVGELIEMTRARRECRGVTILVGGYPFNVSPELWRKVGADGSASNAQEAIAMAERFVA